jgi:hypothetical protein
MPKSDFTLSLDPLQPAIKNTELLRNKTGPTCWHSLFPNGVLAQGFPIAERNEGDGIEIPFELMVTLAQVSISMDYEDGKGGTILIGHSATLIPSRFLENAVQWHYVEASDTQTLMEEIKACTEWILQRDISQLTKLRTLLGYFTEAQTPLGTEKLLDSGTVKSSGLDESKSRIEIAREGTTTAGFSIQGVFQGTIGGKWMLSKTLRVSLSETRDYDDRLEKAIEQPILIYDWETKSAWLVSELSLILHMAITFLRQPRIQQHHWVENGESVRQAWPSLPYAKPSPNGGIAAYEAIKSNKNLYLYTGANGEKKIFWEVVDCFLKDIAAIRKAVNLRKAQAGWQIFGSRLQGWDFNDLATKQTERSPGKC